MNMIKPKPNPQQQLRDWQRKLRQECRNIERQIRGNIFFIILFLLFKLPNSNFRHNFHFSLKIYILE